MRLQREGAERALSGHDRVGEAEDGALRGYDLGTVQRHNAGMLGRLALGGVQRGGTTGYGFGEKLFRQPAGRLQLGSVADLRIIGALGDGQGIELGLQRSGTSVEILFRL
ncbi:hypothetical protein [Sphingomonas sp. CROZ-RG-20F-R02-07]|uniref:hypothetical protein n=1 Tax=Sphingomonas sp. CROZ-RG-20F-R02-07 TaxID=2914832 RepID=UPI001F5AD131|nr:hypothetical protein [Sphingomonas sp. CROZ-RG-20F-R02-07]